MRKILLFKQELVVDAGVYALASKESSVQTVPSLLKYVSIHHNPSLSVEISYLCMTWLSKFDKNFDQDLRIVLLRLTLLVDEDILDVPVLAALLLDLLLQLLVHLLAGHHVLQAQHLALPPTSGSWWVMRLFRNLEIHCSVILLLMEMSLLKTYLYSF